MRGLLNHRLLILFFLISLLSGCAVLELTDMLINPNCTWRGTVVTIEHVGEETKVLFEGNHTAICDAAGWIEIGDWIAEHKTDSGCVFIK